ncbi:hypothetical protein D9619_012945 [Psilocybe cf. subviscida]|uniref:Protein kinase domain-containing protein n=1 Tax=Psilocybe cf. subviscida TaxID=2480587 RepID=A0A8H5BI60_9AGAR|nr:hypothetical protein D9619_012945 [Psilocybe cf. subviscida]
MQALLDADFVYSPDHRKTEEPTRYEPGGYHPTIIGNTLRSPTGTASYRIIHKLGHGAFSTVWLAENSAAKPKYVALKISTSDGLSSCEADHLRSVSSPYVVPVFDSFSLEGPNGLHRIIVTEVLLPLVDFLTLRHTLGARRKIIWELVKAVEDLHAVGLAHGDLHLGNTGVTLPQMQSLSIFDLILHIDDPVMTAVLLDDMTKSTVSLPPYITERCDMRGLHEMVAKNGEVEPQAKLFDFGSVRSCDDNGRDLMYERLSRAPEIIHELEEVGHVLNPPLQPALDIWALGALIYRIITGFNVFGADDLYLRDPSISQTDRKAHEDEWWKERWDSLRKHCVDDADCDTLVSLFKKIFVLEPSKRPSASTIAQDDWFYAIREAYGNSRAVKDM